jgi:hypothetical protein
MQSQNLIGSEKALERELRAQLAKGPPLDLSQPKKIWVMNAYYGELEMNLTKDSIGMLVPNREKLLKSLDVEISPFNVGRISYLNSSEPGSGSICRILYLTQRTPVGKSFSFCSSAGNLATILKYFLQVGSANMRWE